MHDAKHLTVPRIRHQLFVHDCMLHMLSEALEFLSEHDDNRIIYVVDYTEIRPYWDSTKPKTKRDLDKPGVLRVWHYLLGAEQIFLDLTRNPDEQVTYLRRAYDEQMELIDGLLRDHRFATVVLPRHWKLLRDNISYYANWAADAIVDWNWSVTENEIAARKIAEGPKSTAQSRFIEKSESFGYWSVGFSRKAEIFDLIFDFVDNANFHGISDFPWTHYPLSDASVSNLKNFQLEESDIEQCLNWVKCGENSRAVAYGSSEDQTRSIESARDLATVHNLDTIVRSVRDQRVRVAFVTRNHRIHQALSVYRNEHPDGDLPWAFHPRLLTAFMVDQFGPQNDLEKEKAQRARDALSHIKQYRAVVELPLSLANSFVKRGSRQLSQGLSQFLRTSLSRAWDDYRGADLASQIQVRIGVRNSQNENWGRLSRNDVVAKFLRGILEQTLTQLAIRRERALIQSIPHEEAWPEGEKFNGKILPIKHEEYNNKFLLLFSSKDFSHSFLFSSKILSKTIEGEEKNRKKYLNIEKIVNNTTEFFINKPLEEIDDEIEYRIFRFDIILMNSVCLVARKQYSLANKHILIAKNIWGDNAKGNKETARRQMLEVSYLEGIVRRLKWRRWAYDEENGEEKLDILKAGVECLQGILESDIEDYKHKRMSLLLVGFTRELFSFAALHGLSTRRIPLSVNDCLQRLDQVYLLSIEREFYFTAARSRQQFLAFVRMLDADRLPNRKRLSKRLNDNSAREANRQMVEALKQLRHYDGWSDADLPATTRITEALGEWIYSSEAKRTAAELRRVKKVVSSLKKNIVEPKFREYVDLKLEEIDKWLEK